MKRINKKLKEIIDFDTIEIEQTWTDEDIKKIEEKYTIKLPDDYKYYLRHYGNDYIKEEYRFTPPTELSEKNNQSQLEVDSIYGLNDDENKIDDKIDFYKDMLPVDLIPIADLPGGDLICIGTKGDKQNKIYLWFHEMNGQNLFRLADSFESFVGGFQKIKGEEDDLGKIKLKMGKKLNSILNNASKE